MLIVENGLTYFYKSLFQLIIRLLGLRCMAVSFGIVIDAQGTDAHQVLLDSQVTEQL